MSATVVLLGGYVLLLALGALGVERLGRVSTSPRTSRVLAGHRRAVGEQDAAAAGADPSHWPHTDSRALHEVIARVVAVAALVLALVVLLVHHSAADVAVLLVPLVVAVAVLTRLMRARRG